jgi:hypothetical protein
MFNEFAKEIISLINDLINNSWETLSEEGNSPLVTSYDEMGNEVILTTSEY